jgi:hypothetical protein
MVAFPYATEITGDKLRIAPADNPEMEIFPSYLLSIPHNAMN